MNENPLGLFNLEPEENRSVIADNVDIRDMKSNDMRGAQWTILDRLSPPTSQTEPESKDD